LTVDEGRLLWQLSAGRRVLELGTNAGRGTVCLAQQAKRVVTVDARDQAEAREWEWRFGVAERVEFRQGEITSVCRNLGERFDLVFVDTDHDAASVRRDIEALAPLLAPRGLKSGRSSTFRTPFVAWAWPSRTHPQRAIGCASSIR
jgi:predicted O-methyltransferase YrrM